MSDNRANLIAWSAGVATAAGVILAVIQGTVKTPLHNALFIIFLVITCLAFALLLLVGFTWAISRWRSRERGERSVSALPLVDATAITDRWRTVINGVSATLRERQHNTMSHPAYMRRDPLKRPPASLRIGIAIATSELDPDTPETTEVRARFLNFLNRSEIIDLIRELIEVGSASWQPRNESPRFNFAAVLTGGGEDVAPIAWARLLLPEGWAPRHGSDADRASFVLHIELGSADNASPSPRRLVLWQQCFAQVLKVPTVLADFLTDDLAVQIGGDPPVEVALWLEASEKLTELVDIDGLSVVPGSPQLSGFTGYAVAEAVGQDGDHLALSWLRTMSDSVLHLRDSAAVLAPLTRSDGPALQVATNEPEWQVWRQLVYIVAIQVVITNRTGVRIQIGGVEVDCDWQGAAGIIPSVSPENRVELEREKEVLHRHRYSPRLNLYSFIAPGEQISGWVVTDVPWIGPNAGTPTLKVAVRDAVGSEYLNVISRKEAQRFNS